MLSAINILSGGSRYALFDLWLQALRASFQRMGINARVLTPEQDEVLPPTSGLMSIGFNLVRSWSLAWRPKPHLAWLIDHPGFHPTFFDHLPTHPKLPSDPALCLLGIVDARWVEFAKVYYGFESTRFLPHAGVAPLTPPDDWERRPYDVVFFGSVEDAEERRNAILQSAGSLLPVCRALLDGYAVESGQSLDEAWLQLLGRCRVPPLVTRIAFNRYLSQFTGYFLHAGHRVRLLHSVRRHKLHVFGLGPWDRLELSDNIIVHPPVSHVEAVDIMRQSRVLLNHSPLMPWGGHERIFDALLSGCAVLTGEGPYIRGEFGSQAGVALYRNDALTEVDDLLQELLQDSAAPDRIRPSQRLTLERHTMLQRACAIRDMAQERWPEL